MEISLPQSAAELKVFLRDLDKFILDKALEWARKTYKAVLEQVDGLIAEHRDKELTIEHKREVWYQTCLGAVRVRRRQYRGGERKYRYLLDEFIGMGKQCHFTHAVQGLASELAASMPYRRTAEVLRKASAIDLAHQTIWRMVGMIADPHIEQAEQELKRFMATGETPEGKGKPICRLMSEADGVILPLQREKARKAEVKLGIAYEGWERVGKDRYKTVNKTAYAAIAGEQAFWAGMALKLEAKYDLARIGELIIGGDGAGWVKEGAGYLGGRFQLDRYHLNREITAVFGRDKATRDSVWQAMAQGKIESGLEIVAYSVSRARGEQAEKMSHLYRYLWENRSGLVDYRLNLGEEERKGLRRTGAMEGNVDKLVVRRMKNQGMSWTNKGIRRLLCVRFLMLEGKLAEWLERRVAGKPKIAVPPRTVRRLVNRLSMQQPDDWLKAGLPALYGPHASRPWARALKTLAEAPTL